MSAQDFNDFAVDWIQERASAGDLLAIPGVFERVVAYYERQLREDYANHCQRQWHEDSRKFLAGMASTVRTATLTETVKVKQPEEPVYAVHQARRNGNIYFTVQATLTVEQARDCQRVAGYHSGGYGFYNYRTADGSTSWHCSATAD